MASDHPPVDVLHAYGLGKLNDAAAETVSYHLDRCPDCLQAVATMSGDSFLNDVRDARYATQAATPAVVIPPELRDHPEYGDVRPLGRGGMGVVYLARHRIMKRPTVLKVINRSLLDEPGARERFLREIESAAKLDHANIVKAYSAFQAGLLLVFAMEHIDGDNLAQVVKNQGPLPIANACAYACQVARGLQHAFEHGMIHRDIKPQNLMLAREGKKHVVKILDFGLAKPVSERGEAGHGLTRTGHTLGTPHYMAPEQIEDAARADIRADLYSLGCTLYFLLAGRPPFEATSEIKLFDAHRRSPPIPIHTIRTDVPAELSAVIAKLLSKNPAQRYQTPAEIARALEPFFKAGVKRMPPAAGNANADPDTVALPPPTRIERPATVNRPDETPEASRPGCTVAVVLFGICLVACVPIGLWLSGVLWSDPGKGVRQPFFLNKDEKGEFAKTANDDDRFTKEKEDDGRKEPATILAPLPGNDKKQPLKEITAASVRLAMRWIPP